MNSPLLSRGLGAIAMPDDEGDQPQYLSKIINLETDDENPIDPDKATKIELADGGVQVFIGPPRKDKKEVGFDDNLAEAMTDGELGAIADELLQLIDQDNNSRREWLDTRARGIELMGLKIEPMRSSGADGSAPIEGMSQTRATTLCEAVVRFGANAFAELCPSDGPAKVTETTSAGAEPLDELADALETDLNEYLLDVDKPYIPDTDAMLLRVGVDGSVFKKVYHDPILRRPVARAIYGEHVIINNSATSIFDAKRITHQVFEEKSTVIRMQLVGAWRKMPLGDPGFPDKSAPEQQAEEIAGIRRRDSYERDDRPYEFFESYCELDLAGFEHEDDDGKPDGLPLPYKVVIDKEARTVVEIRRNWHEDDDMCLPIPHFVQYPFIRGFGVYGIGLSHLLGNITGGITAAHREFIDSGMFNNFTAWLCAEGALRQNTNLIQLGPGGVKGIQTGGLPINQVVMPLPGKPLDPVFVQFIQQLEQSAQRLGGTAEVMVGEGRQDAPVGTTLALIEQAIKPLLATHKRLCGAQADELQLLVQRFREDPESFWRSRKNRTKSGMTWDESKFLEAINANGIVPRADPNTASHLQRMLRNAALYQMAKDEPGAFNVTRIRQMCIRGIGFADPDQYLNPSPQAPPPDPKAIAAQVGAQADLIDAQTKAQQVAFDQQNRSVEDQNRDQDRAAKLQIAGSQLKREELIQQGETARTAHTSQAGIAETQIDARSKELEAARDRTHEVLQQARAHQHEAAMAGQEHAHALRENAFDAAIQPPPARPKT